MIQIDFELIHKNLESLNKFKKSGKNFISLKLKNANNSSALQLNKINIYCKMY